MHEIAISAGTIASKTATGVVSSRIAPANAPTSAGPRERGQARALAAQLGQRAERRAEHDGGEADRVRHVRRQRRHAHGQQDGEGDDRGAAGHRARGPRGQAGGGEGERLEHVMSGTAIEGVLDPVAPDPVGDLGDAPAVLVHVAS